MVTVYDYIIVGSGINSLTCAGLLAKQGHLVCVLERDDYLGGCIKTAELTEPGFNHDVLSAWHPLFVTSPSYAELAEDLARHGLVYLNTDTPTASINGAKKSCIMSTSRAQNIAHFNRLSEGDGDRYKQTMEDMEQDAEFTFALLSNELIRFKTLGLLWRQLRQRGLQGLLRFFGYAMSSSRDWLTQHFQSEQIHALFAPWILHTGLGPDANLSGAMNRVIAFSLEVAGMPIVKGGSSNLVSAFAGLISENGSKLHTNSHVSGIIVENGRAIGVRVNANDNGTASTSFMARKAVICNVTPDQLYGVLLSPEYVPEQIKKEVREYRYGRACMQIHLALDQVPKWIDPLLDSVPMVHLSDGADSVSKAINQSERGMLPDECTVVVGQPTALDPSRAPEGKSILWLQLQELPSYIKGDAAGTIDVPLSGKWTESVREQYADRVIERLCDYIPNLKSSILSRSVLSPVDLEELNINLVGGDPYSGHCGMQQFFAWRPLKSIKNHDTTVKDLYQIGASTHPGPGLGGNSGYMVAKHLG
jgi:phytoene dehydrogenase-like protein